MKKFSENNAEKIGIFSHVKENVMPENIYICGEQNYQPAILELFTFYSSDKRFLFRKSFLFRKLVSFGTQKVQGKQ